MYRYSGRISVLWTFFSLIGTSRSTIICFVFYSLLARVDFQQQNHVAVTNILWLTKEILACHAHTTPYRSCRQQEICAKLLMNTVINAFNIIVVTLSIAAWDASSERWCCQRRRPVPQRWCPPEKEGVLNCL